MRILLVIITLILTLGTIISTLAPKAFAATPDKPCSCAVTCMYKGNVTQCQCSGCGSCLCYCEDIRWARCDCGICGPV